MANSLWCCCCCNPCRNSENVCVAGRNRRYVEAVYKALDDISWKTEKKVTYKILDIRPNKICVNEGFDGAKHVLLVATNEPRLLILSDTEESQLGNIFGKARKLETNIMLVLTTHQPSEESMDDEKLYHPDLESLVGAHPKLGDLAQNGRFLSVGFLRQPSQLKFNRAQIRALDEWILHNDDVRIPFQA